MLFKRKPTQEVHEEIDEANEDDLQSGSEDNQSDITEDDEAVTEVMEAKKEKKKKEKRKPSKEKRGKEQRPKTEEYILKKNIGMRIGRIVLWVILIFIFFKGIISIFHKEEGLDEIQAYISNFKTEFASYKDENEEVMSFAENFAKEYLTYQVNESDDYYQRIGMYASKKVCNNSEISDFKGSAECIYINAYRKEAYSEYQYDVYVYAIVEYTNQVLADDGQTYYPEVVKANCVLIVPVVTNNNTYIIEDLPVFTADSNRYEDYVPVEYSGSILSDEATVAIIETSLVNFLTAYYGAEQSVIDYYLSSSADKNKFQGLSGRYEFNSLDSISCYSNADGTIVAIVKFYVQDPNNGVLLFQELNILLSEDSASGRYYILDMNTKTVNLQTQEEENEADAQ